MNSIHAAATQFDVSDDTIVTLVDQIADDADLWDSENERITEAGMEILREQISSSEPIGDDLLAEVERTAHILAIAGQITSAALQARDAAIRAAAHHGQQRTEIAKRAGMSRERLYQILQGDDQ